MIYLYCEKTQWSYMVSSVDLSMAMQGSLYLCKTFSASNLNEVSPVSNKTPFHLPFSICPNYALM